MHFVQRDDHVLEEHHMLITEWHCKAGDDTCENVKQLSGTVKLVLLVDQSIERFIDSFSDHLTAGHQLQHISR